MATPAVKPSAKPQARRPVTTAGDILAHFMPRAVLRDLQQLANAFQNEDLFREYVGQRIGYLAVIVLIFVLIATVCAATTMLSVPRLVPPPAGAGLKFLAFLCGIGVWVAGTLAQVYLFFGWVQERALEKAGKLPPHKFRFDRIGFEFLLKKRRIVVPGTLIVICILVPLAILAVRAPLVALTLFVVGLGVPAVYTRIDP
ncbi:MAG TPA: hypothetical protein VFB01_08315 [Burkholderiales bacterium]|nr:hypothetical protein [Burkholderiales bacterium]